MSLALEFCIEWHFVSRELVCTFVLQNRKMYKRTCNSVYHTKVSTYNINDQDDDFFASNTNIYYQRPSLRMLHLSQECEYIKLNKDQ